MKNKLLWIVLLCMFLLPLASAELFTFDNVKSYDAGTKTITIKNTFGLGADIAKIKLNTPLVVKTGYGGIFEVAEFEVTSLKDYTGAFDKIEFYNERANMKKITREIEYKVKSYEDILVNDYKEVCSDSFKNGTQICKQEITGSHTEKKEIWTKLDKSDFKEGEKLTIGIFTYVYAGDYVEWIPTYYGVKINEWAGWVASLDTGIKYYWSFDETTGTNLQENVSKINNMTANNGAVVGTTGKVGKAVLYDGVNDNSTTLSVLDVTNSSYSIHFWYFSYGLSSINNPISNFNYNGMSSGFQLQQAVNTSWINMYAGTGSGTETILSHVWTSGSWTEWVITSNTTHVKLYQNGVLVKNNYFAWKPDGNAKLTIGADMVNPPRAWNGILDELGIWERELTQEEITTLYNGGAGISYGDLETLNPKVTLNSPEDYFNTTSPTINFNVSALEYNDGGIITNVTLYIDGIVNETDTSEFNGTYIFTKILSEGLHNWSILAYNNNSESNQSTTRYLLIDYSTPIFNVYSPTGTILTSSLPANITLNVTSEDPHLSTCWYYTSDNSTNITYTCNTTVYLNVTTDGAKIVYIFANDTIGNENTTQTSYYLNYVRKNATYTTPILEGTSTLYYLNLTASSITSFNGSLIWNGTTYNATASNNGTYGTLTTGLNIPSVSENQNVSLYWNYWLNGINYNSSTYYQIIYYLAPIVLSASCDDKALRFDIQDEENLSALYADINYNFKFGTPENNTYKAVYGTLNNVTTFYLCINASVSQNYTLGYGELDYGLTNYVQRKYYLWEDQIISNNTLTNHSLKSLLTADQTSFLLTFEDTSLNLYTEKYTTLLRWYPNLNAYEVADMGRTDENGQTVAHVQAEDTDYRVGLYETNGTLIKLGDPLRFLCTTTPCTFTLTTDAGIVDYTSIFGVEGSLTYNETTEVFTFIYNDPSQKTHNMTLLVTKETGTDSLTICNTSTSGYTGVLACNTTGYTGIKKAIVYRTASPAVVFAQKIINDVNTAFKSPLGLFISLFIWLAILFAGLSNSPVWVIVLGVIGLIPALITGAINLAVFTGIAVLAGIVLHFIKRALAK